MAFVNGTYYDEFVFPGGTQKFIDGKVLDQFAWSEYDYDEKASRAATPIDYIWVADGIYKWELPIYDLDDVSPNNMRIYTGSAIGCFNLVVTSHPASSNLRFYDGVDTKCFHSTDSVQYDFPPQFGTPYTDPQYPSSVDEPIIRCEITDDGIVESATAYYTTNAWSTETSLIMSIFSGDIWQGKTFTMFAPGTTVHYKVAATDDKGQSATSTISNFIIPYSK